MGVIREVRRRQIELYSNENNYIFSMTENTCSYHAVSDLYRKYCKKLDLRKRISHKARKTFISASIDAGININTIREIAGHADERTTLNNYCYDRSEKAEIMEKLEQVL